MVKIVAAGRGETVGMWPPEARFVICEFVLSRILNNNCKHFLLPRNVLLAEPTIMQFVIAITGKLSPKVLYLGTLHEDDEDTWKATGLPYELYGCSVTKLNLWNTPEEYKTSIIDVFERKMYETDILLLSGGHSIPGIAKWSSLGLVDILLNAARKRQDLVIAGGSAGALCWFAGTGLNLIPALIIPHYDTGAYYTPSWLLAKWQNTPTCICVDENAGFVVIDDTATVISADGHSKCYVVTRKSAPTAIPMEVNEVKRLAELDIIMPTNYSVKL